MAIGGLQNGLAASYDYSAEINLSSTGMILDADAMKAKVCSDLEVMDEVGEFPDDDLSFQVSHLV